MLQQSARGSIILIVGQIFSTIIAAVGAILVARLLGSTNYGLVTVALIPVSIANLFNDLGISPALIKYIAQYRAENRDREINALVKTGFILNLGAGILLSLTIFLLAGYLSTHVFHQLELKIFIEIASINIVANSVLLTSKSVFVGFERMAFYSLSTTISSILKSMLAPVLVIVGYGAFGSILGNTASLVVVAIFSFAVVMFVLLKNIKNRELKITPLQASKILLQYGYPLFFAGIFVGGLTQIYNFLMAIYVEPTIIGNYQAAANFAVLITFLMVPINTVLFPLFSKLDTNNPMLKLVFQNSVKYAALMIVPVTATLMVVSEPLVQIIYGNSYQFAPFFLQLNILNFLFAGLGAFVIFNLLKGQGKTKINFGITLLNVCIGLPLAIILIPRWGIIGLLITTIVATKPGLLFGLWWINKNFGFTLNWSSSAKLYLSVGIASITSYLVISLLNISTWMKLLLGALVFSLIFILSVPLLRVVEKSDIQNLRYIIKTTGPLKPIFEMFFNLIEKLMERYGVNKN